MRLEDLSIIIPTYNRGELLERAIRSVMKQTALPREIVVIDDGSEDHTAELVRDIDGHSGVRVIYHRQCNRGPAAARNKGIQISSANTLAFLDSDDHWHKHKLEAQLLELKSQNLCRISHTREKWLRRGKHLNQKKKHLVNGGSIFYACLELCCVGMSTVMLDRSIFEDYGLFDEKLRCCEDYEYWLRVSAKEKFLLLESPLTIKEGGREDQVSVVNRVGMDKFRIYALTKLITQTDLTTEQMTLACNMLIRKCVIYGKGCVKHGKRQEGKAILELAGDIERYRLNGKSETREKLARSISSPETIIR